MMRRAVENIVRNALRFSGYGQRVTVVLTPTVPNPGQRSGAGCGGVEAFQHL